MLRRSLITSLSCCILSIFIAPPAFAEDGWTSLLDGNSLDGWSVKSGFATYKIKDGVVTGKTAQGSSNSFLTSDKQYSDFELTFAVKVDDGLNSGVQIRSLLKDIDGEKSYGGRLYGPQVEIESGPGQAGYVYGEATGRGWLSPEPGSDDKSVNQHEHIKNGKWNKFRIVAKGANIKTWINGQMIADLSDEEIYKTHPKGMIGLQVHGIGKDPGSYTVRWRNLKIKPL